MASKKIKRNIIIIGIFICLLCLYISCVRREGFYNETKTFNFYNKFSHYGDCILNLKFLYVIREHLKNNNIIINYYYDSDKIKNVDEIKRYVDTSTVNLMPFNTKPENAFLIENNTEMSESMESIKSKNVPIFYNIQIHESINDVNHKKWDEFFHHYYKNILNILNLQNLSIDTSLYQKEDYLLNVYEKLDPKYKNIDILIINGQPITEIRMYNKEKLDALCVRLASKYNVVTTSCVNDTITCTMRDNLKMQDIGAISTHAKYIIGINTGPLTACFNFYAKEHVKKWFILHTDSKFNLKEVNNLIISHTDQIDTIDSQIN